ncbi:hypothetical protein BSK56_07315 [Paenibacillus borealis]|uniref:Uncharacterized protein n=1 Tax=Paenibacillus borealis TaxID=160799 RepID=A0ABX3HKN5_PAEBO|nr:hypothetical protein BSK56_07315 [Paenibacillus borealis]
MEDDFHPRTYEIRIDAAKAKTLVPAQFLTEFVLSEKILEFSVISYYQCNGIYEAAFEKLRKAIDSTYLFILQLFIVICNVKEMISGNRKYRMNTVAASLRKIARNRQSRGPQKD